jgi:hypothetical protein
MTIYIAILNNKPMTFGYTGLRQLCRELKVGYDSAVRGNRTWIKNGVVIKIHEVEVIKIKGRGRKFGK